MTLVSEHKVRKIAGAVKHTTVQACVGSRLNGSIIHDDDYDELQLTT